MQQHRIDSRENRRIRPDGEREGQHGDDAEAWVLQQLANGEAKVLKHGISMVCWTYLIKS